MGETGAIGKRARAIIRHVNLILFIVVKQQKPEQESAVKYPEHNDCIRSKNEFKFFNQA